MEENKSLQECSEQDIGHDLVLDQTSHGGFFQLSAGGWAAFLPFSFPFPFHFPGKRIFIFLKYTSKTLTAFHPRRRHNPRSCCLRSQKELFFEIRSYIQFESVDPYLFPSSWKFGSISKFTRCFSEHHSPLRTRYYQCLFFYRIYKKSVRIRQSTKKKKISLSCPEGRCL